MTSASRGGGIGGGNRSIGDVGFASLFDPGSYPQRRLSVRLNVRCSAIPTTRLRDLLFFAN